jgi:hypothetical protein
MTGAGVVYEGINVTDKYLTVSFTLGYGAAKRFREVKVPVSDLLSPAVWHALNHCEAQRLRAYWEDGVRPLPGL